MLIELEYNIRTLHFIALIYLAFYAVLVTPVFLLPVRTRLKPTIWLVAFAVVAGTMLGRSFYHFAYAYWFAAAEKERFNQAVQGPPIKSLAVVNSHGIGEECDAHCAKAIVDGGFDLVEIPRDPVPSDGFKDDDVRWIPLWFAYSARLSDPQHPCTGEWSPAAPAKYATGQSIPGEYCVRRSVVREPTSRYLAFRYQNLDRRGPPQREIPPFRRVFGIKILDRVQGETLVELEWFDYTAGRMLEFGSSTVSVHPRLSVGEQSFYASPMQLATAWNTAFGRAEPVEGASGLGGEQPDK